MPLLHWLEGRSPDIDTPPPAWGLSTHKVVIPESDDDDTEDAAEIEPIAIDEMFIAIEYQDAKGQPSLRRITLISLSKGPKAPMLAAVCHERRAFRKFRVDRIKNFIDPDDGVVWTPEEFFKDPLDIDISRFGSIKTAYGPHAALRAPLALLMAASRSDGEVHPEEVDAILQYVENELFFGPVQPSIELLDHFAAIVPKLRPQRRTIEAHLSEVLRYPDARFGRFMRALESVIAADGKIAAGEEDFLDELNQMRTRILSP